MAAVLLCNTDVTLDLKGPGEYARGTRLFANVQWQMVKMSRSDLIPVI